MATESRTKSFIPTVGDGSFLEADPRLYPEELQLAFRNKAMPLEGLRYHPTPTGMHYTLVHYDIPYVDGTAWRLSLSGSVQKTLSLSLADLQRRPAQTVCVTLECAGDGRALLRPRSLSQPWQVGAVGSADWSGTPLRMLLEEAGIQDDVREIVFTGLDHGIEGGIEQDYQRSLPIDVALQDNVLLVWAMNGHPLEPQHGYPLRLVVPGWYGMAQVKWLRSIQAITTEFEGYQQTIAYRYNQSRDEPGQPVTMMKVRSLLIPPGIPDFLTRVRVVQRRSVNLEGRAWSGSSTITRVDVSTDGAVTWVRAAVAEPISPYCWQSWSYTWEPSIPGMYELCCRAQDAAGNIQPVDQCWTARGMGNNMVHRVPVLVT